MQTIPSAVVVARGISVELLVMLVLCSQYDEGEMYEQFKVFYDDVLPEFKKAGKVVQFKVS